MQKSISPPSPLNLPNTPPNSNKIHTESFSNLDAALNWDGTHPPVTVDHRIETIDREHDAYSKLVAIAHSVQDQIESAFSNSTTGVRNEIDIRINSAIDTHPFNEFEGTLKKKAVIVELLQRIEMNRSWYEADILFGVDPLSLDSTEMGEMFAAYVDTAEHEYERLGYYENFL